jgi:hypothetical protein
MKRPTIAQVKTSALAGLALLCVAWTTLGVYRLCETEMAFARAVSRAANADSEERLRRRAALDPLLAKTPLSVRNQGFPTSQVDLAFAMRRIDAKNEEALLRSHEALGVHPTAVQTSASDAIRPYVSPGLKIDGWLIRIHWSILRDQGGSSKYSYENVPPVYELCLEFPDELAGYAVWFWGHNFDFRSKKFTCPNEKFESIKDGDWVRVFGVLRPESRVEWEPTKSDELLSLGEMIISEIHRVPIDPK